MGGELQFNVKQYNITQTIYNNTHYIVRLATFLSTYCT